MAKVFKDIIRILDKILGDFVAIGAFIVLKFVEPIVIRFLGNFLPVGVAGGTLGTAIVSSLTDVAKFIVWDEFGSK